MISLQDQIIQALWDAKARLTGSWARGEEHTGSDYDFYVSESRWRDFVKAAPKGWDSCVVGHIAWMQVGIEASFIFRKSPRGKRVPERTLFGRVWKTH